MAKPIKETPILRGKDARVFIERNKSVSKISEDERAKILDSYNSFKAIAKFAI